MGVAGLYIPTQMPRAMRARASIISRVRTGAAWNWGRAKADATKAMVKKMEVCMVASVWVFLKGLRE
jgi:hypothetical protein